MRRFLGPSEVADLLEVTQATLRKWRQRGYGPPFILMKTRIRYIADEFGKWLEEQRGPN